MSVSNHFGTSFRGQTVTDFLEWLTPSSLASLKPYTSTLSVLLNEQGGIIDDTIVTKHASDAFYVVTNAGRRERDISWFRGKLEEWNSTTKGKQGPVEIEIICTSHNPHFRSRNSIILAGINALRPSTVNIWKLSFRSNRGI